LIGRQKLIGWILIVISVLYIVYILRGRLLVAGPPLEKREWIYFIFSFGGVMLGTINVRMAAMREQNQKQKRPN
jgi:hypothetical protein